MARTILITGCSSGIGWDCARTMAARGWKVFATARTEADLQALAKQGVTPVHLDYRDAASIEAAITTVYDATGGTLDALFNNGAYALPGAVEDLPMDGLRDMFEANFFGWHDLTRRIIPNMRKQRSGRIVQCSSVLGFMYLKYRGAYTASKHALTGYSETLRIELDGSGVHVSIIEPGPIRTRFDANAVAAFKTWIDPTGSPHEALYRQRMEKLERGRGSSRTANAFQLGPEAVTQKLIHACESPRPKPHYYVTKPAYLLDAMRRTLPARAMSATMRAISEREAKET
ncbi:MAG: SDR family oxidoreductase [Pseudomonadota bacterium]